MKTNCGQDFLISSIYALEVLQLPSHHQAKILQSMMKMPWYRPKVAYAKSNLPRELVNVVKGSWKCAAIDVALKCFEPLPVRYLNA